jgi:hypothetical protein
MFDTVRFALDLDPEVQMSLLGSPARIANRTSVSRAAEIPARRHGAESAALIFSMSRSDFGDTHLLDHLSMCQWSVMRPLSTSTRSVAIKAIG